jgi:hypothetical protein
LIVPQNQALQHVAALNYKGIAARGGYAEMVRALKIAALDCLVPRGVSDDGLWTGWFITDAGLRALLSL